MDQEAELRGIRRRLQEEFKKLSDVADTLQDSLKHPNDVSLSAKEMQVMLLALEGRGTAEIAAQVGVSQSHVLNMKQDIAQMLRYRIKRVENK